VQLFIQWYVTFQSQSSEVYYPLIFKSISQCLRAYLLHFWLSVRLSVCLSHSDIVSKRLHVIKLCHHVDRTIEPSLSFSFSAQKHSIEKVVWPIDSRDIPRMSTCIAARLRWANSATVGRFACDLAPTSAGALEE